MGCGGGGPPDETCDPMHCLFACKLSARNWFPPMPVPNGCRPDRGSPIFGAYPSSYRAAGSRIRSAGGPRLAGLPTSFGGPHQRHAPSAALGHANWLLCLGPALPAMARPDPVVRTSRDKFGQVFVVEPERLRHMFLGFISPLLLPLVFFIILLRLIVLPLISPLSFFSILLLLLVLPLLPCLILQIFCLCSFFSIFTSSYLFFLSFLLSFQCSSSHPSPLLPSSYFSSFPPPFSYSWS